MTIMSLNMRRRVNGAFYTTLALFLFVVVPRTGHTQILKRIKDAVAQKAAERTAAAAVGVADSVLARGGRIIDLREVTLLPLHFAPLSDSLAPGQTTLLDVLATAVSQLPGNYRLDVYVTEWANASAAQLHSSRRADAVRSALVARGVDSTRLSAFGRGSEHRLASN